LVILNAVSILQQRAEFLEGVASIAKDCNWAPQEVQELLEHLSKELVNIDNCLYDVYEQTRSKELAFLAWESRMEDLRNWMSRILGIQINYI
jgi:hypothetical protein